MPTSRTKTKRTPKKAVRKPAGTPAKLKVVARAAADTAVKPANPVRRKEAGLSLKLFSRLTGFSERAIAGWEAGEPVSESARRRLLETERFRERLAQVVKADAIPAWLETPNTAFDGLKPVEVIERGEIDRLWSMIFYLESGVAT